MIRAFNFTGAPLHSKGRNTPSGSGSVKHQNQIGSIGIHCVQGAARFAAWKSALPPPSPPHSQASGERHHRLALVLLTLNVAASARCVHSLTYESPSELLLLGVCTVLIFLITDLWFQTWSVSSTVHNVHTRMLFAVTECIGVKSPVYLWIHRNHIQIEMVLEELDPLGHDWPFRTILEANGASEKRCNFL